MKDDSTLKLVRLSSLALLVVSFSSHSVYAGVAVRIGQNFTGSSVNSTANPSGAVSSNYVVEFSEDAFAVYNKANGTVVQSMTAEAFWIQTGIAVPSTAYSTSPRIVYDPTVQRWFAADVIGSTFPSTRRLRLAVSATANPTDRWNGITLTESPDATGYLSTMMLGIDARAVYLSSVVWPTNTSAFQDTGSVLVSLPKADLLAIPPIVTNRTWFGYLEGTNYGYELEPALNFDGSIGGDVLATGSTGADPLTGNPQINNTLIASIIQNTAGPGSARLGTPQTILVPPFTEPVSFALQPDGTTNLEDWSAEFTANVYRVGDVLFAAHALQYGPNVAIRWYRISATDHTLLESGTVAAPGLDFYFPSIAANTNGIVVLAFNGSGDNAFVSCYAAVGQTVNGITSFGNLLLLRAGASSYQNPGSSGVSSWGAYSTTSVDPTDPNVFWTINAYATSPTTSATQITQLLTSPSPQLTPARVGTNIVLSWPATAVPFQLESASGLARTNSWSPVTQTVVTNGRTISVIMPATNSAAFFRLVQSQ